MPNWCLKFKYRHKSSDLLFNFSITFFKFCNILASGKYPEMQVYVNDMPVSVFDGAKVKDAINKYYSQMLLMGKSGEYFNEVTDSIGNPVSTDGSLSEDERIYLLASGRDR